MAKKATTGEEYKVLKQRSIPKTIAKVFILIWTLIVIAPVMYIILAKGDSIKEYAVVKGVAMTHGLLQTQYESLTSDVLSKVDIKKYTDKIQVPEIKLDKITETNQKVNQASAALARFGVKDAQKVADTSKALQAQVDKVNKQLQQATAQVQKTLESDIQSALKTELSNVANTQVQKQLGLSQSAYNALVNGKYGIATDAARKQTSQLYQALSQAKKGFLKPALTYLDNYFKWILWGLAAVVFILLLVPVVIVWWVAKKLSATFTQCPYCNKVFLTKAAKFNLLKMLK